MLRIARNTIFPGLAYLYLFDNTGIILAVLALGCLVRPASARGLHARRGCQEYLESYEKLGSYGGAEGVHQKGWKTRGGYFKTVRNINSAEECFQACVDTSKCWSFTYVDSRSKCSMSSKKGSTSSSTGSSSLVQFCPSNGGIAGFIVTRQSSPSGGSSSGGSSSGYTAEDVRQHNSQKSAWVIMDGSVYDVTSLLNSHPGGSSVILNAAGGDAASAFKAGSHSSSNRRAMEKYKIGPLVTSSSTTNNPPSTPDTSSGTKTYTASDVETHSNSNSAWAVVDGGVYDLTDFIRLHPGGSSAILNAAGMDASDTFNRNHSPSDRRTLEAYKIGSFDASSGTLPAATCESDDEDDDDFRGENEAEADDDAGEGEAETDDDESDDDD